MRSFPSAEKCRDAQTGFNTRGVKFQVIRIEARAHNLEISDFDWPKKRSVNFGEAQHESGSSSLVAEPGADAALHHRRRKQTDEQECQQNETKRKQWLLA